MIVFVGFLVYMFESLKKTALQHFQPATSNIDSYFGGALMVLGMELDQYLGPPKWAMSAMYPLKWIRKNNQHMDTKSMIHFGIHSPNVSKMDLHLKNWGNF